MNPATADARRPLPGIADTDFVSLRAAEAITGPVQHLPYSTRALLENLVRHLDGDTVTVEHIRALAGGDASTAIPFFPERILLQDASGIPVLADMVTLRERALELGIDPAQISPRTRMDLVIDHALELDTTGTTDSAAANLRREYERHGARYRFLRWAQTRFPSLRVVPPGIGICHQLNLEVLADVVSVPAAKTGDRRLARLDSVVGTDSHTTMINGLAVVGWGVGGIEATATALGQPIQITVPRVVGVQLTGRLGPGVLATDVALTLASVLRSHGVVERIVEFHGPGLARLSVPDRATIANMAPEYGATMAYFPADGRTVDYLATTGRAAANVAATRAYLSAQGLMHAPDEYAEYDEVLALNLSTVKPTMAGPHRPHQTFSPGSLAQTLPESRPLTRAGNGLPDGGVVIAAITSCTNTSNPRAMAAAGVLARNAAARGLRTAPWTKTSLTPGSRATAELLASSGLQDALNTMGFHVAGFGCGTCMGNSGPLDPDITAQIHGGNLSVAAVLSGNRNFPGRIHPDVTYSYLASPPLVVAMAIAGRTDIDLTREPLAVDSFGGPVYLHDIWPADDEIDTVVSANEHRSLGLSRSLPLSTSAWEKLDHPVSERYEWDGQAGTVRRPPFADAAATRPVFDGDIHGARPLLLLGDGITTDHISPVARITADSAAGRWLAELGVQPRSFGSYSARRLNHDVMLRGGFANPKLQNKLTPDRMGAWTVVRPDGAVMPIHEAATVYADRGIPTIVVAGALYGVGSARDWAAKATRLLGIKAVVARSFERIHRTNLVAMGVLPVECPDLSPDDLDGTETFDLTGLETGALMGAKMLATVHNSSTGERRFDARARIDTAIEAKWIRSGGVMGHLLASTGAAPRRP